MDDMSNNNNRNYIRTIMCLINFRLDTLRNMLDNDIYSANINISCFNSEQIKLKITLEET